jgi:NAD(P)H-flavin reductase
VVRTLRIRDVVAATPRARIVRLDLDAVPFEYVAGQAVLVGVEDDEKRRPYSIAASPEDARESNAIELLVGVDADGRAGLHLPLDRGAAVQVEGPVGAFTFPEAVAERRAIFVAGGTGIAPLRAMMRHALFGPPALQTVGLLYSARRPEEFAYEDEFRDLAARGIIELRQTVTRAAESEWAGARGRIDRIALADLVHGADTLCFVCGPAAMVDEIPKLLTDLGVEREKIRIEEW